MCGMLTCTFQLPSFSLSLDFSQYQAGVLKLGPWATIIHMFF